MNKNKGFTLIELTIVLAILAIIAAILIPAFLTTTDRARLRGDIQSARVIHNAMELYRVERGVAVSGATMDDKLENLSDAGYLELRNARTQTQGAVWYYDNNLGIVVVRVSGNLGAARAFDTLSDAEQLFVQLQ